MKYSGGIWTKVRVFAFILSSAWLIVAGCFAVRAVSNGDIVIDRFQITGGTGATDHDFVTLYNKSLAPIDLNGFRLVKRTKTGTSDTTLKSWSTSTLIQPGASYTWANATDGFAASINADASSSQTLSNDNGVALRSGPENSGPIIDSVGWGAAANIFVETSPYSTNPGANEQIERISHHDTNNNSLDFRLAGVVEDPPCTDDCEEEEPTPAPIVINEFVSDPISGQEEWVELYNLGSSQADVTGWTLEDGGGAETTLSGTINASGFLAHKPGGSLNNTGDAIVLRNATGTIIDQVAYGDWDDGNTSDNAPVTEDPHSIARITDGGTSFIITTTPTKGTTNIITVPIIEEDEETEEATGSNSDIIISELFVNPPGIDNQSKAEFIELYNRGETTISLAGWRLYINGFVHEFKDNADIEAGEYLTMTYRLGFNLDNSGGSVKLLEPDKATAAQTITYKDAPDGGSYILAYETMKHLTPAWSWTFESTPEKKNESVRAPKAGFSYSNILLPGTAIQFDSSDTDSGETQSSYSWNFGDNTTSLLLHPEHAFSKAGTFSVTLTIANQYGESTITKKLTIGNNKTVSAAGLQQMQIPSDAKVEISEIFPNPKGADGGQEWIEVANRGTEDINLKDWKINLKTKSKVIADDIEIKPGEFKVIDAAMLPGALGNASEIVTLNDPSGAEVFQVEYTDAPENKSYAFADMKWDWTTEATPGKPNVITEKAAEEKAEKKEVAGQKIVTGTVVALPNTFSSQYFYIKRDNSDSIEQVYNSKKLFPALKLGDTISVVAEASVTQTGSRLKTTIAEDITITGTSQIPLPAVSKSIDIKQGSHPRLAVIEGEVASKKSPRLVVVDEMGESIVYLAAGANIPISTFNVGDRIKVTGITMRDGSEVRLQPRSKEDIVFLSASTGPTSTATPETVEVGFNATTRDNKSELLKYLILAAVLIAGAGGYIFWKNRKKK